MAKPLQSASIAAPGFYGLNTQESGVTLEAGFALQANNTIIDKYGRLGARKGWVTRTGSLNTVVDDNLAINLKGIHTFIDLSGVKSYLSWNDTSFFKGENNLTTLTPTTTDTISNGSWKSATLNDRTYFFQLGYKPLYYTNEVIADEFASVDTHSTYQGTIPKANTVLSAYGRLWAADTTNNKTTVYFSSLLDGANWGTGSAGSLNIVGTFTNNSDTIVGLGAHNGTLIIFCKNSIVIFRDTDNFKNGINTATLELVETIEGIGCISRDTIVNTGSDIVFLSSTGLRSLGRTIQEASQPLRDLSKNIREDLKTAIDNEANKQNIKAVYSPSNAFYLLAFPSTGFVYCFDTKAALEDGAFRVTLWDGLYHAAYTYDYQDNKLLIASVNGISEYSGYLDDTQPYRLSYFTNYFDLGESSRTKIVKKLGTTVIAPQGQDFIVKVGFDYTPNYTSYPFVLSTAGVRYEYKSAEYSLAEYSGGVLIENIKAPAGGQGIVLQVGVESNVNGAPISIQRLDVFIKLGRVI